MAYNGGLYQSGSRFALGDTAQDIASIINAAGTAASQVVGTIKGTPVASATPNWLVPALLVGAIVLAAQSRRNPPRRHRSKRRRR